MGVDAACIFEIIVVEEATLGREQLPDRTVAPENRWSVAQIVERNARHHEIEWSADFLAPVCGREIAQDECEPTSVFGQPFAGMILHRMRIILPGHLRLRKSAKHFLGHYAVTRANVKHVDGSAL